MHPQAPSGLAGAMTEFGPGGLRGGDVSEAEDGKSVVG